MRCPAPEAPTPRQPRPSERYGPLGEVLRSGRGPEGSALTLRTLKWERAALKVDYPNCPGGGKRGSPPSRKSAKTTNNEDEDDQASLSSESASNCFGFVTYAVNSGERSRVKMKAVTHQPAYSCSSRCDPDRSQTPSLSPSPSPSPRKLRCVDQRELENPERRERHSKRRRAREGNPNNPIDFLWLG